MTPLVPSTSPSTLIASPLYPPPYPVPLPLVSPSSSSFFHFFLYCWGAQLRYKSSHHRDFVRFFWGISQFFWIQFCFPKKFESFKNKIFTTIFTDKGPSPLLKGMVSSSARLFRFTLFRAQVEEDTVPPFPPKGGTGGSRNPPKRGGGWVPYLSNGGGGTRKCSR